MSYVLALKHFWNLPGKRASNCQICVYNAMNCAETTIRHVVYFTNSTLFYHDDHFRQYGVI